MHLAVVLLFITKVYFLGHKADCLRCFYSRPKVNRRLLKDCWYISVSGRLSGQAIGCAFEDCHLQSLLPNVLGFTQLANPGLVQRRKVH